MPPWRRYSRSRGVSSRRRALNSLSSALDRDLARLAVFHSLDRELLAACQAQCLGALAAELERRMPIIRRFDRWIRS